MGDVGDFWRDVKEARRAAGLPARRKVRPLAKPPTKRELREFAAAGLHQCSEWHWQIRLGGDLLDYWPSKNKWRWRGENTEGPWKQLRSLIADHA